MHNTLRKFNINAAFRFLQIVLPATCASDKIPTLPRIIFCSKRRNKLSAKYTGNTDNKVSCIITMHGSSVACIRVEIFGCWNGVDDMAKLRTKDWE